MTPDALAKTCAYCGSASNRTHREHVVPRSRGGPNDASNIVVACERCNLQKSDRTPSEWLGDDAPAGVLEIERTVLSRTHLVPRRHVRDRETRLEFEQYIQKCVAVAQPGPLPPPRDGYERMYIITNGMPYEDGRGHFWREYYGRLGWAETVKLAGSFRSADEAAYWLTDLARRGDVSVDPGDDYALRIVPVRKRATPSIAEGAS